MIILFQNYFTTTFTGFRFFGFCYTNYILGAQCLPAEVNCRTVDADLHKFNPQMSFPAVINYSCKIIYPSVGN